jgi:hypothetical protein
VACGLLAEDCIAEHWCPVLGGHRERAGWRAPCPVCGSARRLSVQVKGSRPVWNLHCGCDRADVRAKLAAILPGCVSARYSPKRSASPDELVALALADMPPQSLRLGLLEIAGMSTTEALGKLGITRTNRYRVVSALRQNRRSLGVSVSIHPACLRFDTSPQVTGCLTGS